MPRSRQFRNLPLPPAPRSLVRSLKQSPFGRAKIENSICSYFWCSSSSCCCCCWCERMEGDRERERELVGKHNYEKAQCNSISRMTHQGSFNFNFKLRPMCTAHTHTRVPSLLVRRCYCLASVFITAVAFHYNHYCVAQVVKHIAGCVCVCVCPSFLLRNSRARVTYFLE